MGSDYLCCGTIHPCQDVPPAQLKAPCPSLQSPRIHEHQSELPQSFSELVPTLYELWAQRPTQVQVMGIENCSLSACSGPS